MNFDIHFRGMDPTDAIRAHVEEKLGKLDKLLPGAHDVLVILRHDTKSRGGVFTAEASLRVWGVDIVAKEVNEDMYKGISLMADSVFAQVRKQKEKMGTRRKGGDSIRNYVPPVETSPSLDDLDEFDGDYVDDMAPETTNDNTPTT